MLLPRITSIMLKSQPDQTAEWLNRLNSRLELLERGGGESVVSDLPIASSTRLGGIMVGANLSITPTGVLSANLIPGPISYNTLTNRPQINSITLSGNKSLADLDINPISDAEIDAIINAL